MSKYTHAAIDDEVHSIAGFYCPQKEGRLQYHGREVLYVVGHANIDNSCCANGCWQYALVPGFILHWQSEKDSSGQPVSEVEPIEDADEKTDIRKMVQETAGVSQVDFR